MRSWSRKDGLIFEGNNDDREVFQRAFPSVLTTKVLVGTEPVDIGSLDPIEKDRYKDSLNIPDDVFVITVIQRYRIVSKGIDRYPKLAAHLKKRLGDKFIMLLYGDGADSGALAELIESNQVGGVCRMMGMLTDLRLGLAIADLSLSGRHGRDTGVAGLQAAFCGIPGLGVQMKPGAGDLHDWMPNSENLEELAELIVSLIERPSELQELAIRQKAHVEAHHSTKSMTDGTLRFYKEVLGAKVTPGSALVDLKQTTNSDSFAVSQIEEK
jgi:glycosyltransferase involved in cell wall biosynthesis